MSAIASERLNSVNLAPLTCPKCNSKATLTDFGSKGLCGTCRNVWPVLDKFMKH